MIGQNYYCNVYWAVTGRWVWCFHSSLQFHVCEGTNIMFMLNCYTHQVVVLWPQPVQWSATSSLFLVSSHIQHCVCLYGRVSYWQSTLDWLCTMVDLISDERWDWVSLTSVLDISTVLSKLSSFYLHRLGDQYQSSIILGRVINY